MKKTTAKILVAMAALTVAMTAGAQYLGVTCGFNYEHDLDGPIGKSMNFPLFNPVKTDPNASWQNWAEELAASGVDFVCPNLRGAHPNNLTNPTNIAPLVEIINKIGLTSRLKIGLFDDNAASWTAQWNLSQGRQWAWAQLFDMGDTNNWKYLYDYNYKLFYDTVPDANRFKIHGRPLIIIWTGDKNMYLTNMQGNASRAITYVRECCQRDFGFDPFIVLENNFFTNDTTCLEPGIADGGEGWTDYNDASTAPFTLTDLHGNKVGTTLPSFKTPGTIGVNLPNSKATTKSCFKDPDHARFLSNNLAQTHGAGALVTLVEGFTDWEENAALFAVRNLDPKGNPLGYDKTFYDYPNQRINALRCGGNFPFPAELKVEVENCDRFGGASGGNGRTNYYRNGNLAIEPTTDTGGGWDVGWINAGEWFEWQELPMQGSQVHLQVRVASTNNNGRIHFVIDGKNYPKLKIPDTGGNQTWLTVDSGKAFKFARNGLHTVKLVCDTGGFSINYWRYQDAIPLGQTISLRSKANNQWVTAGDTGPLLAGGSEAGFFQQFQLIDASVGYWHGVVALQSVGTHHYVTADPAGASPLAASRSSTVGPNELFQWIDNGDGTISLRSLANYLAVSVNSSGTDRPLMTTTINPAQNESFTVSSK